MAVRTTNGGRAMRRWLLRALGVTDERLAEQLRAVRQQSRAGRRALAAAEKERDNVQRQLDALHAGAGRQVQDLHTTVRDREQRIEHLEQRVSLLQEQVDGMTESNEQLRAEIRANTASACRREREAQGTSG